MPVVYARCELLREPARGRVHHVLSLRLIGVKNVVDVVGTWNDEQRLVVGPGRVELVLGLRPEFVLAAVDAEQRAVVVGDVL